MPALVILKVPHGMGRRTFAEKVTDSMFGPPESSIRESTGDRFYGPFTKEKDLSHWQLDCANDFWLTFSSDSEARLTYRYGVDMLASMAKKITWTEASPAT